MKNINPTHTSIWKKLKKNYETTKKIHMFDLFKKDQNRFKKFSLLFNNKILIDYSKNRITDSTFKLLLNLAKNLRIDIAIKAMFIGKKINQTENQAVLHIALRNIKNNPIILNGINIMHDINHILKKMEKFSNQIINSEWKGYTGKSITDIVNIGIGGSHIGQNMVVEALKPYKNHLKIHFLSNIDGTHIEDILNKILPERTLFLITSKTFKTKETIINAKNVKKWFLKISKNKKSLEKHFIAISNNEKEVNKFGINTKKNLFKIFNWINGRYSLWSAMGLIIVLSVGYNNFKKLLYGAHDMDEHFKNNTFDQNIPVILALISIWYNNFFKSETELILPYNQNLYRFSEYIQQIGMESNGKSIDRNGKKINYQTGSIIWGGVGTNYEHTFCQLIHQGTKLIPCDFIVPVTNNSTYQENNYYLIAHFLSQSQTLAFGNIKEKKYKYIDYCFNKIKNSIPYKKLIGNNPSNTILLNKITPYTLGALIAMYEHKVFIQGAILNIFSFDQWGIEYGKKITNYFFSVLKKKKNTHCDSSTNGLIKYVKNWKK
ncbi:MAG: glucose-6-phosphate isomerase [Arsenophonus sp.]|nr:MAG: glucose-6-phosphate isomerase [Arsenophonus sp.]